MKHHGWGLEEIKLPAFGAQPTEDLRLFLQAFFILDLPETYFVQHYVCTSLLALLHVCGILIVIRGVKTGKWWLFRIQVTESNRKLIIPNGTSCYVVVEGMYFWFWIIYTYYSRSIDMGQMRGNSRGYLLVMVWYVCWLGAWLGAIGTYWVVPGAALRESKSSMARVIPSPVAVNFLAFAFPILLFLGVLIPSVLGGMQYSRAWHEWKDLDLVLLAQPPSAPISSEQSQTALKVWRDFAEAYFRVSIGFCLQTIGAIALSVTYIFIALSLVLVLRGQIRESEILFASFNVPMSIEAVERRVRTWNSIRNQESERAAAEEEMRAAQSTFIPSVTGQIAQIAQADSPEQRSKILREALSTIITLALCINVSIIIFISWSLYVTSSCYEVSIQGPAALTTFHRAYHLIAAWNGTACGVISFYLILNRTYQTFFETAPTRSISSSLAQVLNKILPNRVKFKRDHHS